MGEAQGSVYNWVLSTLLNTIMGKAALINTYIYNTMMLGNKTDGHFSGQKKEIQSRLKM